MALIPAVFVPIWSALSGHMTLALMFSPLVKAFLNTSARASNVRFHPKRHVRPVALKPGLVVCLKRFERRKAMTTKPVFTEDHIFERSNEL